MKHDLYIKNGIIIPGHEIIVTSSRSGGPGGQHVNKTSTRITLRWNVKNTSALNDEQKERVLQKLHSHLTTEGDLIIHSHASRSQHQNKEKAFEHLAQEVRNALYIPKTRMATRRTKTSKEERLYTKTHRGEIKKMRSKKPQYD